MLNTRNRPPPAQTLQADFDCITTLKAIEG